MPTHGGVGGPLAFALITHWLGAAIEFGWGALAGGTAQAYLQQLLEKFEQELSGVHSLGRGQWMNEASSAALGWFLGAGTVLLDPFVTLASIFLSSSMIYVGARILVATPVTFEAVLRIVCYGLSPAILSVLPLVGIPLSRIYMLVVTVIGAREVFRIGTGRALVLALFPKLLVLALIAGMLGAGLLLLIPMLALGR